MNGTPKQLPEETFGIAAVDVSTGCMPLLMHENPW